MTIDEAIKEKEQYHEKYRVHMLSKEREADQLSIEALKRIYLRREHPNRKFPTLLSGETVEK